METRTLKIETFEDKPKKTGGMYTRFKTNEGWMSCFDTKASAALKELNGKYAEVGVKVTDADKGWANITNFIKEGSSGDAKIPEETQSSAPKTSQAPFEKDNVGLAVELFVCLAEQSRINGKEIDELKLMGNCIKVIQFARAEFK